MYICLQKEAGYCGVGFIAIGFFGSFIASAIADRTKWYKTVVRVTAVLLVLSVWFSDICSLHDEFYPFASFFLLIPLLIYFGPHRQSGSTSKSKRTILLFCSFLWLFMAFASAQYPQLRWIFLSNVLSFPAYVDLYPQILYMSYCQFY